MSAKKHAFYQPSRVKRASSADHKVSGRLMEILRETGANSTWVDPDDAPEWTQEQFERADLYHGDKLIRRGRPRSASPKRALKLRLDPDVVEHFRATGPGWQTRINDTLRRAVNLDPRERVAVSRGDLVVWDVERELDEKINAVRDRMLREVQSSLGYRAG
jgi:uncharacterized protein (DUF4415 family)